MAEQEETWHAFGNFSSPLRSFSLCLPVAVLFTLLLLPVWSRVGAALGIAAVGPAGPAAWCFVLVYVVLAAHRDRHNADALAACAALRTHRFAQPWKIRKPSMPYRGVGA